MHSSEDYTPNSTYLRPTDMKSQNSRQPCTNGVYCNDRNNSPLHFHNNIHFNCNTQQYQLQHNKWGSLRSKIKMMKLDNITVRSYKDAFKINDKFNNTFEKVK